MDRRKAQKDAKSMMKIEIGAAMAQKNHWVVLVARRSRVFIPVIQVCQILSLIKGSEPTVHTEI